MAQQSLLQVHFSCVTSFSQCSGKDAAAYMYLCSIVWLNVTMKQVTIATLPLMMLQCFEAARGYAQSEARLGWHPLRSCVSQPVAKWDRRSFLSALRWSQISAEEFQMFIYRELFTSPYPSKIIKWWRLSCSYFHQFYWLTKGKIAMLTARPQKVMLSYFWLKASNNSQITVGGCFKGCLWVVRVAPQSILIRQTYEQQKGLFRSWVPD